MIKRILEKTIMQLAKTADYLSNKKEVLPTKLSENKQEVEKIKSLINHLKSFLKP